MFTMCSLFYYQRGGKKVELILVLFISGRVLALYHFNYFLVMLGVCLEEAVKKLSSLLPCLDISNNLPLVIFISRLRCGSTDTEDEWGGEIAGRKQEAERTEVVLGAMRAIEREIEQCNISGSVWEIKQRKKREKWWEMKWHNSKTDGGIEMWGRKWRCKKRWKSRNKCKGRALVILFFLHWKSH